MHVCVSVCVCVCVSIRAAQKQQVAMHLPYSMHFSKMANQNIKQYTLKI